MTNLLLKTKRNYFNGCNSSFLTERRDRESERKTRSNSGGEFWEDAGLYIRSLVQLKVPRTNCEQIALSSSVANYFQWKVAKVCSKSR